MSDSGTVTRSEYLLPGTAEALGALLGVPVPDLAGGAGLPLLWHWVYLLDHPAQADLGPDGHPERNTLPAPPGPGRRRMWAGGSVRLAGPLRAGEVAEKRSRVLSATPKPGRSGKLTIVVVQHQIRQRDRLVVDERQDIVYRDAVEAPVPLVAPEEETGPEVPPDAGDWTVEVSPALLFRFSALTYNAHRIHYDRDYARTVEGYPGLVTHGPLQAICMAGAASAVGGESRPGDASADRPVTFGYRLTSPLFDHQGMIVRARPGDGAVAASVRDRYGRESAVGTLRIEG